MSIPQKAVTEDAVLVTHNHFHYMGHKKVDLEHLIIGLICNISYCISIHEVTVNSILIIHAGSH